MADDVIQIEILADGTIKSTTDPISAANHSNAEKFFKLMRELAGGEQTRARRSQGHTHTHTTQHNHEKAGQ
jgi:hypothetical protein